MNNDCVKYLKFSYVFTNASLRIWPNHIPPIDSIHTHYVQCMKIGWDTARTRRTSLAFWLGDQPFTGAEIMMQLSDSKRISLWLLPPDLWWTQPAATRMNIQGKENWFIYHFLIYFPIVSSLLLFHCWPLPAAAPNIFRIMRRWLEDRSENVGEWKFPGGRNKSKRKRGQTTTGGFRRNWCDGIGGELGGRHNNKPEQSSGSLRIRE